MPTGGVMMTWWRPTKVVDEKAEGAKDVVTHAGFIIAKGYL